MVAEKGKGVAQGGVVAAIFGGEERRGRRGEEEDQGLALNSFGKIKEDGSLGKGEKQAEKLFFFVGKG